MIHISVIIPVHNEDRTIASIIQIIKSWGKAHEIIVVNDGSTDKTLKAIAQFKQDIIILSEKENHGKGYAMAKGIEKATGDIVLFLDGDLLGLTHQDLDRLVQPMLDKKADMTVRGRASQRFRILSGERRFSEKMHCL